MLHTGAPHVNVHIPTYAPALSHIPRASSGDYNQINHGLDLAVPAHCTMAAAGSVTASTYDMFNDAPSEDDSDNDAGDYNEMSHTLHADLTTAEQDPHVYDSAAAANLFTPPPPDQDLKQGALMQTYSMT